MKKLWYYKIFGFVKQVFVSAMTFFCCNLSSVSSLKCISLSNQERNVRRKRINININ